MQSSAACVRIISLPGSSRVEKTLPAWRTRFENVSVLPAVVGWEVPDGDLRVSCGLYRRLKQGSKSPFTLGTTAIHMSNKAQLGCALSHIAVWQETVEQDRATIVVEDDCLPQADAESILRECTSDFVSLMNHSHGTYLMRDGVHNFWGMQAYFIRPVAARALMRFAFPLDMHIDRLVPIVAQRLNASWRVVDLPYVELGKSTLDHVTIYQICMLGSIVAAVGAVIAVLAVACVLFYRRLRRCRETCAVRS